MDKWISVNDSLPSETDDYLTYYEMDGIPIQDVHTWLQKHGHFSCETPGYRFITHWQPLPEPPQ